MTIKKYEDAGYTLFPIKGKIPTVKEWQLSKYRQYSIPAGSDFGVVLQDDDLIIDCDPRSFKAGDAPHKRLIEMIPSITHAMIVKTGGGGLHFYMKKPKGFKIKKSHKNFKGLDFLSGGCYVVGAGSKHLTGTTYTIAQGGFGDIFEAPQALLNLIKAKEKTKAHDEVFDDSTANRQKYITYLSDHAPIAISGQGGNNTTFKTACRGRDFGLSEDVTSFLMKTYWNDKCKPAWGHGEIDKIVQNAYTFNNDKAGKFHPSNQFEAVDVPEEPKEKTIQWHLTSRGDWQRTSLHNVCNFFNSYERTSELHNLIGYNVLSHNIEFLRRPFWLGKYETLTGWDDNDCNAVMKYLSTKLSFNTNKNLIHETALAVSTEHKFHPVVDYLESLEWDGKKRIHNWLSEYMRVKETEYTNAVGELLLRAAIKRVYEAGCKMDYMVVLEGEQGIGKSSMIEILGHDWYADLILNVHSPDTVDSMKNKWIIEVSEMECSKRADAQAMKSFLSRRIDTCRLAYARASKDFPRSSIFIGSFNPDAAGSSYLKDVTGDRRYLPITVEGSTFLDFKKFKKDIGQIWAEALVRYKENPNKPLYLTDKVAYEQAVQETHSRRNLDTWIEQIELWLDNPDGTGIPKEFTTANEVYTHALSGQVERFHVGHGRRIANIMVGELGWNKKCSRIGGKVTRHYVRPKLVVTEVTDDSFTLSDQL